MAPVKTLQPPPAPPARAREEPDPCRFCVTVPATATTLGSFRAWSASDDFPDNARITFLGGEVIIDMSPERLYSHGQVRVEITRVLSNFVVKRDLGKFYTYGARFVHEEAAVSNEPDAMFARWETLKRSQLRPIPTEDQQDYIELEGAPDWVLEVASPSSRTKDTVKLRERYHRASVSEYWLVDALGEEVAFVMLLWEAFGYQPAPGKAGWQRSRVFGRQFRLVRTQDRLGQPTFELKTKK